MTREPDNATAVAAASAREPPIDDDDDDMDGVSVRGQAFAVGGWGGVSPPLLSFFRWAGRAACSRRLPLSFSLTAG
jgi:hypothetical protein